MTFQPDSTRIVWCIHLASPPEKVYSFLATDAGRAAFWAESAVERDGSVHFTLPNGAVWQGKMLEQTPPQCFSVVYYGGSITTFDLADDGTGGTDLALTDQGVPDEDRTEVIAGWVSVLMALKAAVDFGVDLRTHDPSRIWDQGFADN